LNLTRIKSILDEKADKFIKVFCFFFSKKKRFFYGLSATGAAWWRGAGRNCRLDVVHRGALPWRRPQFWPCPAFRQCQPDHRIAARLICYEISTKSRRHAWTAQAARVRRFIEISVQDAAVKATRLAFVISWLIKAGEGRCGVVLMPRRNRPRKRMMAVFQRRASITKSPIAKSSMAKSSLAKSRRVHPLALRVMHWLTALAIIVLIGSGWQIYNASPIFPFTFPRLITIGGWLGAAIAWHLAAIWLLMINGLCYLIWGFASGHFREKFWPVTPRGVWNDARAAFTFRLKHQQGVYNAVQRLLYIVVIGLGIAAVLSGLAVWKPVQLWWLSNLMGGYRISRIVHFVVMAGIVGFIFVHLLLVALVPRVLPSMITGGRLRGKPIHEVKS
jgi:thiosulfate reductase cytochrome b subunit